MKNLAALLLSIAVLCVSPASHAQEAPKVPRVGWLWIGPASPSSPYLEAFRQGMRALNYVEGQSYVLDAQYTAGKNELLPEQVSALVRARADVIVAGPAPALLAAKQMTTTIPLVMTLGADPVSFGVATVSTPTFLDPEEAYFCSAVLHSAVDCANCPSRMGGDFSMLHNPGAINSIGPETFSWCEQFFVRGNEVCREGPIEGRM